MEPPQGSGHRPREAGFSRRRESLEISRRRENVFTSRQTLWGAPFGVPNVGKFELSRRRDNLSCSAGISTKRSAPWWPRSWRTFRTAETVPCRQLATCPSRLQQHFSTSASAASSALAKFSTDNALTSLKVCQLAEQPNCSTSAAPALAFHRI